MSAVWVMLTALLTPTHAQADEPPTFILQSVSGKERVGPLEEIEKDWNVRLGGDTGGYVAGTAVVSLQRANRPHPGRPRGPYLALVGGDILPGNIIELSGESLRFQADLGSETELKLPLSAISLIWLATPEGTDHPDQLRRRLVTSKRSRDIVYLRNGDTIEGVLNSLDTTKVELEVDKKDVAIEFGKVAAIALNTDLARPPKLAGPHAQVVLANGARLTLTSGLTKLGSLRGQLAVGAGVQVRISELAAVHLLNGPAVYLSELKPQKYEYKPYLGPSSWPYEVDANVQRGDLRLGEAVYDRGIGMHAASQLTYDLGGSYRRFEALVGIDFCAAEKSAAKLQVLVDGKPQPLGPATELTRRGTAKRIAMDVTGARELTLVVDLPARVGATPGDVDWIDARLIKAAK
jgi:hypothetical protein